MDYERMRDHIHNWVETGRKGPFAGDAEVTYVRCEVCSQNGFRKPPSPVVYTWQDPVKNSKNNQTKITTSN